MWIPLRGFERHLCNSRTRDMILERIKRESREKGLHRTQAEIGELQNQESSASNPAASNSVQVDSRHIERRFSVFSQRTRGLLRNRAAKRWCLCGFCHTTRAFFGSQRENTRRNKKSQMPFYRFLCAPGLESRFSLDEKPQALRWLLSSLSPCWGRILPNCCEAASSMESEVNISILKKQLAQRLEVLFHKGQYVPNRAWTEKAHAVWMTPKPGI